MSSQGLNAASYHGFYYSGNAGTTGGYTGITFGAGIPTGLRVQNASDYTKRTKESLLYREYASTANMTGSSSSYHDQFLVPVDYRIVQSNEVRKSYQFGRVQCGGCTHSFPTNSVGT